MSSKSELPNRALRSAVKQAQATATALSALSISFVNRGCDATGAELTRSQFRAKITVQSDLLRQQLRDVLDKAILER